VARFWEWSRQLAPKGGLGYAVGVDSPAAKVVFTPLRGKRARGRPGSNLKTGSISVDNFVPGLYIRMRNE